MFVVAHSEVGDDLQAAAGEVEEPGVDGDARVGNDRRGAGQVFVQPAPFRSVPPDLDDAPAAQQLETCCRQRADHDHFRSGGHRVAGKRTQDHPLWVMRGGLRRRTVTRRRY
jgi:hypothetical protein